MSTNPATILQNEQVAASTSYMFWINFLTNRYLSVRGWEGLPPGYKADVVNTWIKEHGNVVLFKRRKPHLTTDGYIDQLMMYPAELGELNEFGQPNSATVTLKGVGGNGETIELQYGEFVVYWDFNSASKDSSTFTQSVSTSILYYAGLISQAQRSIDNIVFWRGIPKIFGADEKTVREIEKVLKATDMRSKAVFALKNFVESKPMTQQYELAYGPEHDKILWENISEYIKAFDISIGFMPDTEINKGERVSATESLSGYAAVMQLNDSRERCWEESYEEALKLFGDEFDTIPSCFINNKPVDFLREMARAIQPQTYMEGENDNGEESESKKED